MVVCQVALLEYRRQLELVGRYLVVAGVGRDSEAVAFQLQVKHESFYAGGDGAEIMVFELLVLGALVTHEGAAGHHEVGTGGIQGLVDEEVFLFPTEEAVDVVDLLVEVSRDAGSGLVDRVQGAEERGLEVERFTGIGDEDGRDTEGFVEDEHRGGDVPGRVSAGLERVSYAAVGEAGSVRLLLHEEFAGKFLDYAPLAVVLDKGVVFLGGASRQGCEPVGVVTHSVVKRPLLHPGCHAVGELEGDGLLVVDGVYQFVVDLLGKIFEHFLAVEHQFAVVLLGAFCRSFHANGFAAGGFADRFKS